MLKSDRKGFLVIERSLSPDELTHGIQGVKRDTAAIITLLKAQAKSNVLQRARVANPISSIRAATNPGGGTGERDNRGRFVKSSSHPVEGIAKAVRQMTRQQAHQAAIEKRAEAAKSNREGNKPASGRDRGSGGRFGAGNGEGEDSGKDGLFARLKSAFSDKSGGGDFDKVDPAIEAAHELKTLIGGPLKSVGEIGKSVIGRGFNGDAKDKTVPWYRNIVTQLKLLRSDESAFSKAEVKAIAGVKSGSGGGADGSGLFGGLGNMIPVGALTALKSLGGFAAKASLPLAAIFSAVKSFGTGTDEYASRMGVEDDGGVAKSIAIRTAGVLGDLGNTLTLGMAGKLGEILSPATSNIIDASKVGIEKVNNAAVPVIEAVKKVVAPIANAGDSLLGKIIPGYRHKAAFDGIKGGDSLTKNGSYSDAEADQIRQLKNSGANTSASLPGGMPKDIQQKIIAQANAAGLDPSMMLKEAAMESGGNANAVSKTGAIGIYQFTGRTASKVGVKDRFDADQNIAGGMQLTQENLAILKKSGLPVNAENLYMMHQLGPSAAKEVISGAANGKSISDLSADTKKAVALNYGSGAKTAAEYLSKNSAALTARADTVIGKSTTGFLPTTLATAATSSMPTLATLAPAVAASVLVPAGIPSAAVSAPSVPAPAPRADIPVALNNKGPLQVIMINDQLANRDLKDRRLAAISTGGLSN